MITKVKDVLAAWRRSKQVYYVASEVTRRRVTPFVETPEEQGTPLWEPQEMLFRVFTTRAECERYRKDMAALWEELELRTVRSNLRGVFRQISKDWAYPLRVALCFKPANEHPWVVDTVYSKFAQVH